MELRTLICRTDQENAGFCGQTVPGFPSGALPSLGGLGQGEGWVGCSGQLCQEAVWGRGLSPGDGALRPPWLGNWACLVARSHLSLPCSGIRLPPETGGRWEGTLSPRRQLHVLKCKAEKTNHRPQALLRCTPGILTPQPQRRPASHTILGRQKHLTQQPFQGGPVLFQLPGVHPHSNFHRSSQL